MAEDDLDKGDNKPHRSRLSGRKAEKKKAKNPHVQELTDKQRNPKAFAIKSAVKAERSFRRTEDLKRKKEHIPVVDRTPLEPPPIVVAIVGPPKVGKSLLLKCLIKSYSRQPLTQIKGPLTIVSGKKQRVTFIECNNDINSMIDIAKVADLVLLIIDASFGFEMEIFEFLNICQVHGMPKIMGVLNHLDLIKRKKKVQQTKKILKHRFWKEVYPGAKLFYLSGLNNNAYLKNEIKNLARFISVMKFRPLTWQTSHSYVLADRMEDITPPEKVQLNPKVDRTVCLYGYMRGIPMNKNCFVHIPGSGDYAVKDISFLPDPCPLPEQIKKRSLLEKERSIYAPFSGVGGIVYDKDAIYVDMPFTQTKNVPEMELMSGLLETKETIDVQLAQSTIQLFSESAPITGEEVEMESPEKDGESSKETLCQRDFEVIVSPSDGRKRRKVLSPEEDDFKRPKTANDSEEDSSGVESDEDIDDTELDLKKASSTEGLGSTWSDCSSSNEESDDDESKKENEKGQVPWEKEEDTIEGCDEGSEEEEESDMEDDEEVDTELNWKTNLAERAAREYIERQKDRVNLTKLVYGGITTNNNKEDEGIDDEEGTETGELGGLFKVVSQTEERKLLQKDTLDGEDSSKYPISAERDWANHKMMESIKDCFVTGKWSEEQDAEYLLKLDDLSDDADEELYGDFEDYTTGEKHTAEKGEEKEKKQTKEELMEKKRQLKEKFDSEYDNKGDESSYFEELKLGASKQSELNRRQFEDLDDSVRVEIEGFRAGLYVRLEIDTLSCEFVEYFDPTYPVILGSVQPGEQNTGFVKVRIKNHRWYNKILKTKNPLVMSLGWRRFQTIAVFSKQEDNMRHRMLKYTPQHVACMAHFWGPLTKAGTGFLAFVNSASPEEINRGFRIAASGSVVDTNQTTMVTKKLKLIGEPIKVFKKTAFVKGMFHSGLEVARFEGAKIKTVSGIRGQVKKPLSRPEGAFRATFEDKILLSDIVFCRMWYRVEVPQFYASVTNLLLPPSEKNAWQGLKTVAQLKRERGIKGLPQNDSLYTEIKRPIKRSRPLIIPRALEKELPYKYKTKVQPRKSNDSLPFMKQAKKFVVRNEHESQVANLMQKIKVNFQAKQSNLKREMRERVTNHRKQKQNEKLKKLQKHKELKKSVYRTLGKIEKDKMNSDGSKNKKHRK